MGNTNSSPNSNKSAKNEFDNFYDIIDYIATYYILTMDFKSLSKLSEKEYCDKLVILTSDIIKRYFNDTEVTYLAQRVKDGLEVNDLTKENVIFVNRDQLESLDISNDAQKSIKKKRVCIGIAKFYVKIAHIFAAIVMTINPVYTYKDETGKTVKTGLMEKDKIPKNVNRKLYKLNICDNRIRALKKGETVDPTSGNVTIQPKVCDINMDTNGMLKNLENEPGIPELMRLYLDDNYDYSNGNFTGMSNSTKLQFSKDLKTFYTAFTGKESMPPEITKFSDIKLRDYNSRNGCQGSAPIFKNKYTLNKNDKLFTEYADNTKKMIQVAASNQSKLLSVINDLFTYVIDPYSGKRRIRVNPKLTDELLQKTVEKTRKLIIDLYVKCELDYVNGIKLYEAIVESKILETTQKQIESLKSEASKIIEDTSKTSIPTKQTLSTTPVIQPIIVKPSPIPDTYQPVKTPTPNTITAALAQQTTSITPTSSLTSASITPTSSLTSTSPLSTPSSTFSSTPSSTTSLTPTSSLTSTSPLSTTSSTPTPTLPATLSQPVIGITQPMTGSIQSTPQNKITGGSNKKRSIRKK
jgi:hypothetical protein